jgi:hypothetical protein
LFDPRERKRPQEERKRSKMAAKMLDDPATPLEAPRRSKDNSYNANKEQQQRLECLLLHKTSATLDAAGYDPKSNIERGKFELDPHN